MKALINGKILMENEILEDRALLFDAKIREICKVEDINHYEVTEIIDAKNLYISPGFIDIHIHGSGGFDTMDGDINALEKISKTIAAYGTTSFLPTTMTMEKSHIIKALDTIKKAMSTETKNGANILGVHLEGPFINPIFKGAQNSEYIIEPDYEFIKNYLDIIKIITIAPEIKGSFDFMDLIKQNSSAVLSIGHSNATYEEAMEAIERGISHSTHIFNAMTPLHHRNPGVVGAVFNSEITCELIADKIHVHPELFRFLIKAVGENRICLITDSMRAGCMKDGCYDLGGQSVIVKDGSARLSDGQLAGSVLTLNLAVKNFFESTDYPLNKIVNMVSINTAKVIGFDNQKGSIEKGKDADIILFDKEISIKSVFIEGKKIN